MTHDEQSHPRLPLRGGRGDRDAQTDGEPPSLPVAPPPRSGETTPRKPEQFEASELQPTQPSTRGPERSGAREPRVWLRMIGPVIVAGLLIYLCRQLGPASFGLYALALAIGSVGLYLGWVILPRFWRRSVRAETDPLSVELAGGHPADGLQLGGAAAVAAILLVVAGLVARGYGAAPLGWPLRWTALAVAMQGLVWWLRARQPVAREPATRTRCAIAGRLVEAIGVIALVSSGAGIDGAVVGTLAGCAFEAAALWVSARGLGRSPREATRRGGGIVAIDPPDATVTWAAVLGVGVVVAAAVVDAAPLGRLGAALGVATVLGYGGRELAGSRGSAWRVSAPGVDVATVASRLRLLVRWQGLVLAPLVVWPGPLMLLLFGDSYEAGAGALRLLTVTALLAAPAWLTAVAIWGSARSRDSLVVTTLSIEVGVVVSYILSTTHGIDGAALSIDLLLALLLLGQLWIARTLIDLELPTLLHSMIWTFAAAVAMASVLYAIGTRDLSLTEWLAGAIGGAAAYFAVLLAAAEISLAGAGHIAVPVRRHARGMNPATEPEALTRRATTPATDGERHVDARVEVTESAVPSTSAKPHGLATVMRGFLALSVATAAGQLIGFAVLILVARRAGPANLGAYTFASSFASYFQIPIDFGVTIYAIREIAQHPARLRVVVGEATIIQAGLLIVCAAVALAAAPLLINSQATLEVLPIVVAAWVPTALSFDWAMRAMQRMGSVAVWRLAGQVVYAALAPLLIGTGLAAVKTYAWLNVVGAAITAIGISVVLLRRYGRPRLNLHIQDLRHRYARSAVVGLSIAIVGIYYQGDSLVLGYLKGTEAAGIFGVAYRIPLNVVVVGTVWLQAAYPNAAATAAAAPARFLSDLGVVASVAIAIALAIGTGATILAPQIMVGIFGEQYRSAATPLMLLTWSSAIALVQVHFSNAVLAISADRSFLIAVISAAFVNLGLDVLLIPSLGPSGGGIATIMAETVVLLYTLRVVTVRLGFPRFQPRRIVGGALAAAVMGAALIGLKQVWPLWPCLLFGTLIYLTVAIALKVVSIDELRSLRKRGDDEEPTPSLVQ